MSFRRIITTGLYRSGTTRLYNAVRLLAIHAVGKYAVYGCFADDYDITNRASIHVVKAAEYLPGLAAGSDIVWMYRPLEDVRASMARFAGFHPEPRRDTSVARIDEYLRWLLMYASHGARGLVYVDGESPYDFVQRVQGILRFDVTPGQVEDAARRLQALQPPETGTDPASLLHAHHITSQ